MNWEKIKYEDLRAFDLFVWVMAVETSVDFAFNRLQVRGLEKLKENQIYGYVYRVTLKKDKP